MVTTMTIRVFACLSIFVALLCGCRGRTGEDECAAYQRFIEELRLCQYHAMSEELLSNKKQARTSRMLVGWESGRACTSAVVTKYPQLTRMSSASKFLGSLDRVDFFRYISFSLLQFGGQPTDAYLAAEEAAYILLEQSERELSLTIFEECQS